MSKNRSKRSSTAAATAEASARKKRKTNERVVPVESDESSDESFQNNVPNNVHNDVNANPTPIAEPTKPGEIPAFSYEEMNKLLENVKKEIPDNDALKYNTRIEKLDWNKVKLDNYTVDECKKIFNHGISFTRKYKTLNEILTDAQQSATKKTSKMYRSNKDLQKPRHPSSSYMIFANEIREKLRKQNPNLSIIEIGKLIGEKWRQLTAAKKDKYLKKFEENKKVYLEEISKYNIEHNQPEKKKRDTDSKPKTPLAIYLSEKLEKDNPDLEGKNLKEKQTFYKNKYNQLSDKKKFKYIKKCMDAEEKFIEKLKETLKTTNVDYKSVLNKQERDIVEKMNGKPSSPPVNGYALFIKENIIKPEFANAEPKLKNSLLATKWKAISKAEKDGYNNRAKLLQEQFLVDMTNYVKNLPEKEAIELYMNSTSGIAKDIIQRRISSLSS